MQGSEVKTAETPGQPDTKNRGKWVHVMCSEAERIDWKAQAAEAKLTLADLIRVRMATKKEGRAPKQKQVTRRADPELIRSVGRVGSNLNQIARWANTYAGAAEAAQILAALVSIDESIAGKSGTFLSYRPDVPAVSPDAGHAE